MERFHQLLFLAVVVVAVGLVYGQAPERRAKYFRNCQEAGLCCDGVNNTCFVDGARRQDGTIGRCFCDSKCLHMDDCCTDFQTFCQAQDCVMGEWSDWTKCNNPCGLGSMQRKRAIVQDAKFGGTPCEGPTHQKRTCKASYGCLQNSVEYSRELMTEVGYIMPASFSVYRYDKEYSPLHGIRKNLFFKYYDSNIIPRTPGYCATYRLTHSRSACSNSTWAGVLEKGTEICVECQPPSMDKRLERCRGHGVFRQETDWNAIEVKDCHGKWKMITKPTSCTCNNQGQYDFVLV